MKPSGIGLAVPVGAAPVAVAVRAAEGTPVLIALTASLRFTPVEALSAPVLVAAEELLVMVMVLVQEVLEAAEEASITLAEPAMHWE